MIGLRSRTVWLISLFVLVDLAVIVFAFSLSRRGGDSSEAAPTTVTTSPSATSTGAGTLSGPLTLTASPTGALARVTRGSCDSRAPVQAQVWVAASFKSTMKPRTVPGMVESLGVDYGERTLTIVGADSACKVRGYTSEDAGATWTSGAVPRRVWWLDPDTTSSNIHGPVSGRVVDLDCVPISVTTESDGASVSCQSAGFRRLDGQGRVVGTEQTTTGLVAAASAGTTQSLLLAGNQDCGALLLLVRGSQQPRLVTCLGNDVAPLGLAVSGSRWFVQAGFRLAVSENDGRRFATYAKDPVTSAGG